MGGRQLRVMMLIDSLAVGGAEDFATQLATHLDPQRFRVTFCVSRWTEESERTPGVIQAVDELASAGVELMTLDRPYERTPDQRLLAGVGSVTAWRPLLHRLRQGVDVLHAHKFGSNVWGALLASLARTPVFVAHEQTWSFEGQRLRRFLDRALIARRADTFVAVSSLDRGRMIEIEGIDPDKIVVIRNGVPTPAAPQGHDLRAERSLPSDAPIIGALCRLYPQKALDVLLRAAAQVRDRRPEIRVVIAGEGPERARLESLTAELGLERTVIFLGRRDDVADVLAAFDVAVLSSDFEGTPLALMECMEAGLPIVATRVGGVPEMIEDGVHGLLVEPQDPSAMAASIERLLADPDRAGELGAQARRRRREEFDIDVAADRFGELYERLYAESGRAGAARVRR
jgi:glycosyltransferase involved in cell wall biosynthesis